ncbi:MAG: sodium/glutamate symporter [Anderseniella sp.]
MNVQQTTFLVPDFLSVTLGMIVFFLGAFLTRKIGFLRNYNIPEPVSGGMAIAVITWAVLAITGVKITFDLATRDVLLVIFFATIGLNARVSDLISGGRTIAILVGLTVGFIIVQNVVGLAGTILFDLPRPVGVLLGSASLIGGHGTAIAWGPTIAQNTGFAAAAEVGIAAATLGLIVAALMGGPIAKFLIDRNGLQAKASGDHVVGLPYDLDNGAEASSETINHISLMSALLAVNIAIILGYFANQAISAAGLKLPLFVPCLLVGVIMSNTLPYLLPRMPWPARTNAMSVISDYSLSVFLAMSLMSMQLWTLAGLGGPLIGVLVLQALTAAALILLVVFRIMGSDYTAAVLSAGFAGFTLGATPTAIANMASVTKRYGPAPMAFILLPLVSAFFVDLANAVIIQYFAGL